jgi:hypothetical protein
MINQFFKKERIWDKSDIGKIIFYKSVDELEKGVIYEVNQNTPTTIRVACYPFGLYKRICLLGLNKNQEKENKNHLKKIGDWSFLGEVSKEEKGILEEIAKSQKILSDEPACADLNNFLYEN